MYVIYAPTSGDFLFFYPFLKYWLTGMATPLCVCACMYLGGSCYAFVSSCGLNFLHCSDSIKNCLTGRLYRIIVFVCAICNVQFSFDSFTGYPGNYQRIGSLRLDEVGSVILNPELLFSSL